MPDSLAHAQLEGSTSSHRPCTFCNCSAGAGFLLRSWNGVIYGSAPPRWSAGRNIITGAGSMKAGARFNTTGSFPIVYGSTTPELAMIESLAFQRRAGVPVEQAMPLVFKAI